MAGHRGGDRGGGLRPRDRGVAGRTRTTSPSRAGWPSFDQLSFLSFALLPVAIGVAVLRYRLYDIDVVINRALVYGSLTAMLVGDYLGSVLLLQLVLQPAHRASPTWPWPASTLAVAALFGPARRRIQVAVDRRFYRHKYDAARTRRRLQRPAAPARSTSTRSAPTWSRIADDAVQPTDASLWLRSRNGFRTPGP